MRFAVLLLAALLAACGVDDAGSPSAGPDASASRRDAAPNADDDLGFGAGGDAGLFDVGPDAGSTAPLLIGTGQDRFEPLAPGATLDLVAGPQGGGRFGGHHVLLALRLSGVAPSELTLLEVRLREEDGTGQAYLARDPARSPFINGRDLPNLTPRLDDCCAVAGRPLTIEVKGTRAGGGTITTTFTGTASACPNPAQGPSICP